MKNLALILLINTIACVSAYAQEIPGKPALVNYDDYEKLVKEVKRHRAKRLLAVKDFTGFIGKENVILLDTRPKEKYDARHIKGAVHLNFADFTQENLARVIPSPDATILIYCNNNFEGDPVNLASKSVVPGKIQGIKAKPVTLALNIPTYINLYGYGYKNVYELKDLVSVNDKRITFEGSAVPSGSLTKN